MEDWQVINEFPNYDISNFGNIKSDKTNRLLKIQKKSGYSTITLSDKAIDKIIKELKKCE